MNREDIIRMAREAGAEFSELPMMDAIVFSVDDERWNSKELERFAALVASAEREACAKVCEDSWMAFSRAPNRRLDITPFPELEYVAKVIRARGQA